MSTQTTADPTSCTLRLQHRPAGLMMSLLVAAIAWSLTSTAALSDGVTAAWGSGNSGELGNNNYGNSYYPVTVDDSALDGQSFVQVSAGYPTTCGVTALGKAYCWGANYYGQLGNGNTGTGSKVPVAVSTAGALSGKTVTQISVGDLTVCAVTTEGKAYCWGVNSDGTIGDGTTTDSNIPVPVSTADALSGKFITQISTAHYTTCAVTSEGKVYCWGSNDGGALGAGVVVPRSTVPVAVSTAGALSGKTVTQVSVGTSYACAVDSGGAAYCWGNNDQNQLGTGGPGSNVPVAVSTADALNGKSVRQISAGVLSSCAVTTEGKAYCWGNNDNGQLGDGGNSGQAYPVAVSTAGVLNGKFITKVSVGNYPDGYACATTSEGKTYCWGNNDFGQLGDGTTNGSNVPIAVDTTAALGPNDFSSDLSSGAGTTIVAAPYGGPGRGLASGLNATWQQMALPCVVESVDGNDVETIFGTNSPMNLDPAHYNDGSAASGQGWVVWRLDTATNKYVRLALTDTMSRGTGYWLLSYQPGRQNKLIMNCLHAPTAPVTQAEGCSSTDGCYAIPLTTAATDRSNLVGNPFPYAVDWSAVRIRINGSSTTYTPSQAACATGACGAGGNASVAVISNVFYVWNGTSYTSYSDSGLTAGQLPYFSSFWVKALSTANGKTVELLVPRKPTSSAAPF